jgi:hypothetical protein
MARVAVASAKFEAGQVLLPEQAPWLPDLEAELFAFPAARHNDQCDSISQALEDNNTSFMQWMTPADWQNLLVRPRIQGQMDRVRRQFHSPTSYSWRSGHNPTLKYNGGTATASKLLWESL